MTEPTIPHLPCRTKLAKHLSLHGLMQSALAHAAKMNPAYLSMLLSGRKPLTDYHKLRLNRGFEALNLPAPW